MQANYSIDEIPTALLRLRVRRLSIFTRIMNSARPSLQIQTLHMQKHQDSLCLLIVQRHSTNVFAEGVGRL